MRSYRKSDYVNENELEKLIIPAGRLPLQQVISPEPAITASYLPTAWRSYASTAFLYLASFASTLPVAVYAFIFPLKMSPAEFSLAIWRNLSWQMQATMIAFALVTTGIGVLTRLNRLPIIWHNAIEMVKHYCDNLPTFFKTNFILLLALTSAIAMIAVGYQGFVWAGAIAGILSAAIHFLSTFGFRIEAMPKLLEKMKDLFNKDVRFQKNFVNELKRLKPEHIAHFEEMLKENVSAGSPLDEKIIRQCLLKLYDKTSYIDLEANNVDNKMIELFYPLSPIERIKPYVLNTINIGLGLAVGASFFIFFSQMGYKGTQMLCELVTDTCAMDLLPYMAKLGIAIFMGISASTLGFVAGNDLVGSVMTAVYYAKGGCKNMCMVFAATAGCSISATSLAGAVKAMTDAPNLFEIAPGSGVAFALIGGNWVFSTAFDLNAIIGLFPKSEQELNFNQALSWLEKNKLSKETLDGLRQHSYFNKQIESKSKPLLLEDRSNRFSIAQ